MQQEAGDTPWLEGPQGAVSLQPKIPDLLQEVRTVDALPGEHHPEDDSPQQPGVTKGPLKPNEPRGEAQTLSAGPSPSHPACGCTGAVQCELPKTPLP